MFGYGKERGGGDDRDIRDGDGGVREFDLKVAWKGCCLSEMVSRRWNVGMRQLFTNGR